MNEQLINISESQIFRQLCREVYQEDISIPDYVAAYQKNFPIDPSKKYAQKTAIVIDYSFSMTDTPLEKYLGLQFKKPEAYQQLSSLRVEPKSFLKSLLDEGVAFGDKKLYLPYSSFYLFAERLLIPRVIKKSDGSLTERTPSGDSRIVKTLYRLSEQFSNIIVLSDGGLTDIELTKEGNIDVKPGVKKEWENILEKVKNGKLTVNTFYVCPEKEKPMVFTESIQEEIRIRGKSVLKSEAFLLYALATVLGGQATTSPKDPKIAENKDKNTLINRALNFVQACLARQITKVQQSTFTLKKPK